MVYRFENYELDMHCQELRRMGAQVKVEPQAFRVLAYLVQHRDRVVAKQELAEQLWAQSFASDEAMARCLRLVRQALGDSGRTQQFIRTMYGNGYRFVATVEEGVAARNNGVAPAYPQPGALPSMLPARVGLPSLLPGGVSVEEPLGLEGATSGSGLCLTCTSHVSSRCASCSDIVLEEEQDDSFSETFGMPAPEAWCASRPAMATEWKPVTALSCSMANLAPLGAPLDPEVQHNLLYEFFSFVQYQVQQHGGHIQYHTDDGFLALLGVPVACEDHAWRALQVAMALQQYLEKSSLRWRPLSGEGVTLRIGVHTGRVVEEQLGHEPRMTYMAWGDVTHLAVRLQQGATPGAILLSATTARQVQNAVRLETLGAVYLPGETAPTQVYQVRAARSWRAAVTRHAMQPRHAFIGRQWRLQQLHTALERASSGQGQIVGIASHPGMGKSRLLHEFRHSLRGRRVLYLEGRCSPCANPPLYSLIREIICQLCRITSRDALETRARKLRRVLASVGLDSEVGVQCLLQLLNLRLGVVSGVGCNPEAVTLQALALLRQMCLHGSQQQPLVVAVENLHWIDPASERLCDMLVNLLAGAPILFLMTYRLGYQPQWLSKSYMTPIILSALTPEESLRLVQAIDETSALPPQKVQEILSLANGNPLFIEELVQSTWPLPATIENILMTRLSQLAASERRLLQTAAVLGPSWSLRLLEAIWDSSAPLEPLLWKLQQEELLYEHTTTSEPTYAFRDRLMREVAYYSLLPTRRQILHTVAVHAMERL